MIFVFFHKCKTCDMQFKSALLLKKSNEKKTLELMLIKMN